MNEAVANIWKDENRRLRSVNNETLSGTKFLWLTNQENFLISKRAFNSLKLNLYKVGKGWQIKEAFRYFWSYSYR
ncbi:transposase domain protein [Leptospira alstonii serovar Pingchang str. 80-412]|uniref:Transposase domain protein n=1 Tax=Leptospira alstonii serovar Pingchang str. 80-412 TaxID=1218564 RepID=T0G6G4_9LEPT|nr:transposase domain protein [Leptospira alstonii serovar Pingchang str. 80-412]